jgi:hypothetical protein
MKISALIQDIVRTAEDKFGVSNHLNDVISVGIYAANDNTWQVWLDRPTQNQMDKGEVERSHTSKLQEMRTSFNVERETLLEALLALHYFVYDADDWEEGHVANYIWNN